MGDEKTPRAEHRPEHMRRRIGISRRDLLRRGAVVGGTLIWTVPVISSLSQAHKAKGSPLFVCCWCKPKKAKKNQPAFPGACETSGSVDTKKQCDTYCKGLGASKGNFHSSPNAAITCDETQGCGPHTTKP